MPIRCAAPWLTSAGCGLAWVGCRLGLAGGGANDEFGGVAHLPMHVLLARGDFLLQELQRHPPDLVTRLQRQVESL